VDSLEKQIQLPKVSTKGPTRLPKVEVPHVVELEVELLEEVRVEVLHEEVQEEVLVLDLEEVENFPNHPEEELVEEEEGEELLQEEVLVLDPAEEVPHNVEEEELQHP